MRPTSLYKHSLVFLAMVLLIMFGTAVAFAQSSSFTYQGRLTDGGTPANGNYDLQFALWNSLSGGAQIGSPQTINTVAVSNGVFTVSLDFGAGAFTGASRFLEISARPAGSGSFTPLTPRQEITSTPYAVRSLNAASADSVPASGVPAGSGNYIQNSSSQQSGSNFNISGNGAAGGTLTGNVVNATTQYNLNGSRILSNAGNQNLFAGIGAGQSNTGTSNSFFGFNAGNANTSGAENSFFGLGAGASNTTVSLNSFFGAGAGLANTTGSQNSFFGARAGFSNTTGINNAFFGLSAGGSNSTGGGNAFFGTSAGGVNTTGAANSFFGTNAGISNTTGHSNAFFGSDAGFSNTTGGANSFFGEFAGQNNRGGAKNTLIGNTADVLSGPLVTIDNATAIGTNARVDASNSLVLGSINGVNFATADTNVGIGTTTPRQRLHVKGQGLFTAGSATFDPGDIAGPAIRIGYDSNGDYGYINANNTGVTAKNLVLQPNSSQGNVGIGTTAPLRLLHVNGRARIGTIPLEASNASVCFNGATGDLLQCGASSLKWKTNVRPFLNGLDIVRRLRPISFNWKQDGHPDIGLGAEDVAKVAPSLTFVNSKGEAEGVKYERLNMLLINAIKEQQAQIATLQQVNSALNARLQVVEKSLKKKAGSTRRRQVP